MDFDKAWSEVGGEIESHPDAPDLIRTATVKSVCEVFYEIGKLVGIDRHNEIADAALSEAMAEMRARIKEL